MNKLHSFYKTVSLLNPCNRVETSVQLQGETPSFFVAYKTLARTAYLLLHRILTDAAYMRQDGSTRGSGLMSA